MRTTAVILTLVFAQAAIIAQPSQRQLPGHVPTAVAGLTPLGRLDTNSTLQLAIGLPLRNGDELDALLRRIYDPSSPDFHHYLTTQQFTERFGPSLEDYQSLSAFAVASGLRVTSTHPNRVVLDVEGSVAQIEKVLHVTMRVYRHPTEKREFFSPDVEPSIDLKVPILHIGGLDNFVEPRSMMVHKRPATPLVAPTPALGSGLGGSYQGYDFRAAYLPGVVLTGAGQTVGLMEFGSGFSQSDITAYETATGLPSVPVTPVLLDGYGGGLGSGNDEVSLDIEMAISMAPGLAGVLVYEGNLTDDILNRMVSDDLAKQISSSWTYSIDATSEADFKEMAVQGQSFFNASGDGDAWVGSIQTPCADTNIIIVGGTSLTTTGPGGTWRQEQVWNLGYDPPGWPGTDNGYWGSGGGTSTVYNIPPWQKNVSMTSNQGSTSKRNIPDVALTADNIFVTYSNGLSEISGGTSAASPLWAGVAALMNQQATASGNATVGFLDPAIYAIGLGTNYTSCFHDIVIGNNTNSGSALKFSAVPGYDLCTGWGTPAGEPLIDALAPDALGVTPATGLSASGLVGGPFAGSSEIVLLTNRGSSSLSWACVNTAPWLSVAPTNGTIAPGAASTAVTVSLSPSATNLLAGVYTATIWFTNFTDHIGQRRQNLLLVNLAEHLGTYGATLLSLKPAGYWPLNELVVPPVADVVSNVGSLGLLANGFGFNNVLQGQAGIVSNSIYFSNSNLTVAYLGTYVDVPYNPALNSSGPFTVEFWAKPNQAPTDFFCPVSSLDDSENANAARYGWVFYEASGNQWSFRVGNINGYVATLSGGTLQPRVWQHVAGVYDGANVTLYVNGVAVAGPTAATGYSPNTNQFVTLRMGATSFGNRTFDGNVDEVAVYTNALSAGTIFAHYQAATTNNANYGTQILASHPVGYWHLDEPAYNPAAPGSLPLAFNVGSLSYLADGTYLPGSIPGVPGVPDAGFGSSNTACSLGAVSYIDVPGGSLEISGPLTLSAWVKAPATLGQIQSVASLGGGEYELTIDGQGRPNFVDGSQTFGSVVSSNRIDNSQWHQLVGVYDGIKSEFLYVDGQLAARATNATVAPVANTDDFWIGGDPDVGAFQFFNGVVDEVAIFATALSADEILWLYSSGFNATLLQAVSASPSSGTVSLTWAAISGETYSVEYSTNLGQSNWSVLGSPVTATNSTATVTDSTTNSERFYRIVLVP